MQFSRIASLTAKRLLLPGTVLVLYTHPAHCAELEKAVKAKIFTWGTKHKLDIFVKNSSRNFPKDIVDIALASEIEAAIDEDGALFIRSTPDSPWKELGSFGSSGWFSGQSKAVQCAAYGDTVYVVDEAGDVWRKMSPSDEMNRLNLPELARSVAMAEDRVAVVSREGHVFMEGTNEFGQCGLGDLVDTAGTFVKIPERCFDSPVVEVALGGRHTLFRTKNGRVFSCGSNDSMQLGLPWTREKCWLANEDWLDVSKWEAEAQIMKLEPQAEQRSYYDVKTAELYPRPCLGRCFQGYCKKIGAGEKHSVALIAKSERQSAEIYSWGSSMRGQLGHRNVTNMCEPTLVSMLMKYDEWDERTNLTIRCVPTDLAVGANHTLVTLTGPQSKMIFGVGDNSENQLSTVRQRKFAQPIWIKKISPMNGLQPVKIVAGENKSGVLCKPVNYLTDEL